MYLKAVLLEILILARYILQHAPQNVEIPFNTAQTTPVLCMFFITQSMNVLYKATVCYHTWTENSFEVILSSSRKYSVSLLLM